MKTRKKKIVFPTGGKGGSGKTTVTTALAEWYEENQIPCTMLDLDIENKKKGSFSHFFPDRAVKIDINTPAGLDAFIDHADKEPDIILADMGAGSGKVSSGWFNSMYESIAHTLAFTAIGVVTSDPASVESLLNWAAQLQNRVSYLVVLNQQEDIQVDFTYWERSAEAAAFRAAFKHRLNNGAVYQLKGFAKTGDLKLTNGWVIGKDYGNLAHGYCQTSHVAQSKTVDRVFVAQSSASLGASSAEQFYVSVSRAREAVAIYTDDKARLAETIQSSGARMTAHELLKLPVAANVIGPFESMLRDKAANSSIESCHPRSQCKMQNPAEKQRPPESPQDNQLRNLFSNIAAQRLREGMSL